MFGSSHCANKVADNCPGSKALQWHQVRRHCSIAPIPILYKSPLFRLFVCHTVTHTRTHARTHVETDICDALPLYCSPVPRPPCPLTRPQVLLWDPHRPESPYSATVPDGAPVLRLAPSPFGDCLALSTNRGLHCMDLIDGSHTVTPVAPFPLQRPFADIAWNAGTGELYASNHGGSVCVFMRN